MTQRMTLVARAMFLSEKRQVMLAAAKSWVEEKDLTWRDRKERSFEQYALEYAVALIRYVGGAK